MNFSVSSPVLPIHARKLPLAFIPVPFMLKASKHGRQFKNWEIVLWLVGWVGVGVIFFPFSVILILNHFIFHSVLC